MAADEDESIPSWLSCVASREEIAKWKAIRQAHHGPDLYDRKLEFQRKMREKHSDMPLTVEEEVEQIVKRLETNPWLRWYEGMPADRNVDEVVSRLTIQERMELATAIQALESLEKRATVEKLPPSQRAVWEKATRLYQERVTHTCISVS
jgi:hypothetical protein